MAFIRSILGFIIAAILAALAIFNRDIIDFTFSPAHPPISIPLYAVLLGGLLIGFILGAILAWISEGKHRREKRAIKKQLKALEKQLKGAQKTISQADPAADMFPEITTKK